MANVCITEYGLQYCLSANDAGPLVALKWFIPVYDPRVDSLIHDAIIPVEAISAVFNPSASEPYGEKIWNTPASDYSQSDVSDVYLLSGDSTVATSASDQYYTITNPLQSQSYQINLHSGVLLSDHYLGTSAIFNPAGPSWNLYGFSTVSGDNTAPVEISDKFFPIIDYFPAADESGHIKGAFKARLSKDIGTVLFNKIALYAVRVDTEGNETGEPPVFFAEVFLKTPVVKTDFGANGFDDITVDCQLDLQSISADWNDIFYSTSGDYWSRTPGGLYYPEKIGVGQFVEGIDEPQAAVHIRRPRDIINSGLSASPYPNLRLDYDDSAYMETQINADGSVETKFNTSGGPDVIITTDMNTGLVTPSQPDYVYLGDEMHRFGGIDAFDKVKIGNYPSYLMMNGQGGSKYSISASDDVVMTFNEEAANYPLSAELSYIEGADITKYSRNLSIYTKTTTGICAAVPSDVFVGAGVLIDLFETSAYQPNAETSQSGLTHKNLEQALNNEIDYEWLDIESAMYLYGRKNIKMVGPIELDSGRPDIYSQPLDSGFMYTKKKDVILSVGLSASTPQQTINRLQSDTEILDFSDFDSLMNYGSNEIAALKLLGGIHSLYSIAPLENEKSDGANPWFDSNLGIAEVTLTNYSVLINPRRFNRLFVKTIGAYADEVIGSYLYADNRVEVVYAKDVGKGISGDSRVNRVAVNGVVDFTGLDIGLITNNAYVGDSSYPEDSVNYLPYYGIYPKTSLTLGHYTEFLKTLNNTGDKSIWNTLTNNINMSHNIYMHDAFTIIGGYKGDIGAVSKVNTITTDVDESLWPGIHPTYDPSTYTNRKTIIGEESKRITKIYCDTLDANNIAGFGAWDNLGTSAILGEANTGYSAAPLQIREDGIFQVSDQSVNFALLDDTVIMNINFTIANATGGHSQLPIKIDPYIIQSISGRYVRGPVTSNVCIGSGYHLNSSNLVLRTVYVSSAPGPDGSFSSDSLVLMLPNGSTFSTGEKVKVQIMYQAA
jgi:hypothetical protein